MIGVQQVRVVVTGAVWGLGAIRVNTLEAVASIVLGPRLLRWSIGLLLPLRSFRDAWLLCKLLLRI
jgi:hypothetical protein